MKSVSMPLKPVQESGRGISLRLLFPVSYKAIMHNLMPGAGIIAKHACNSKYAMHNIFITAACKAPSYTQSTVLY